MADSIDISGAAAKRNPAQPGQAARQVPDELAEKIKPLFHLFLSSYVLPTHGSLLEGSLPPQPSSSQQQQQAPVYLKAASQLTRTGKTTMYIDYTHLAHFHPALTDAIRESYHRLAAALNGVVHALMLEHQPEHPSHKQSLTQAADAALFRAAFFNLPVTSSIRDLKTARIGHLMAISGTVTRTSAVRPELHLGTFRCADCKTINANIVQQFKYTEPNHCLNSVCENRQRWTLDTSLSSFSDWQLVRIQENSHEIPAGSMPRSMKIVLRHESVELAKPGDKCTFTGTLIVVPDIAQMGGGASTRFNKGGGGGNGRRQAGDAGPGGVTGLKDLGVRDLTYSLCFLAHSIKTSHSAFGTVAGASVGESGPGTDSEGNEEESDEMFTEAERDRVQEMKSQNKLYTRLVSSIAPNIFGHDEIKRGILLMLFGGVHKRTVDGQNLRGDINLCIVGDPSTSKSQFLKYVCTFLPRAVYTSGKASSAAGLTASIARDPETGEFAIEAGALMLADNGICCIDEFDKMEPSDQVAIHEAMEQQTISIAKAGIQATLNARTSILAAANPLKGRYDPSRTLKQNVDISAPIMSRFDLFFVVLDEGDQAIDYNIARHIVNVHMGKETANRPEFTMEDLQLYIRYARTRKPAISPAAKALLVSHYGALRSADSTGTNASAYRITVRQLESMIRLSEARARLDLSPEVTASHVQEAARLLKKSIVHVDSKEVELEDEDDDDLDEDAMVAAEAQATKDAKRRRGEMDDDADMDMGASGGGGGGGDDDDQDQDQDQDGGRGPRRSASAGRIGFAARKPASGIAASDAEEGKASDEQAEGGAAVPAAPAAPAKESVKLSFTEYQRITLLLVHFLRSRESSGAGSGTSWKDLVNYYVEDALVGGAAAGDGGADQALSDLVARTKTVELVIHRLIKTDHILLLLRKSADKAKRLLAVHPNFTGEGEAMAATGGARARTAAREEAQPVEGSADEELLRATADERQAREHAEEDKEEKEEKEEKEPADAAEGDGDGAAPMDEGMDEAAPATPSSQGQRRGRASQASTPSRTPSASQGATRAARSKK